MHASVHYLFVCVSIYVYTQFSICFCVYRCECQRTTCGSQFSSAIMSNSECQPWQVLLPVEPNIHWPRILHFLHTFFVCDCGRWGSAYLNVCFCNMCMLYPQWAEDIRSPRTVADGCEPPVCHEEVQPELLNVEPYLFNPLLQTFKILFCIF